MEQAFVNGVTYSEDSVSFPEVILPHPRVGTPVGVVAGPLSDSHAVYHLPPIDIPDRVGQGSGLLDDDDLRLYLNRVIDDPHVNSHWVLDVVL